MERQQSSDVDKLARELSDNGVIAIESYLDTETCDEIRSEVVNALNDGKFEVASEGMSDSELMDTSRTIVNKRSGDTDAGMLDIFNIDETIPEIAKIRNDEFISDIINRSSSGIFSPENINIYYNQSVTNTRGYHFDSYNDQFKAFIYLTDVPDESYGPYSYIIGSNKKSHLRRRMEGVINRLRGRPPTDAITFDSTKIKSFTAPKGTLIISDQTGYHRGIPQEEGKKRMLISNSRTEDEN